MFVAVVEAGGFARAAARLRVSSGQASKLVTRLEQTFGIQLLNRTTRALSPTEMGLAYFERIKAVLAEIDALDNLVGNRKGEPSGRLRMTVPASLAFSQLVPAFIDYMERHHRVELDVNFSDRVVNLVDEGFDAAIRVGGVPDLSLIARRLGTARVVAAASPDYISRRGVPADPAALKDHVCIIDTNFREPMKWKFHRKDCSLVTVDVVGRLLMSSAEACLTAAEHGFGIVRMPSFMIGDRFRDGRLVPLLLDYEDEPIPIHVIYPPTRHLTLKLRSFIDFLVEHFKGEPWWDRPGATLRDGERL